MNKFRSICLYLLWAIASFCLFLYFASKFSHANFGNLTIPQILIHWNMGTDKIKLSNELIMNIAKHVLLFLASSAVLFYFTYLCAKGKNIIFIIYNAIKRLYDAIGKIYNAIITGLKSESWSKASLVCISVLILISAYALVRFEQRIHLVGYLKQEESVFFNENYYRLDVNKTSSSDKNLLVIFMESMEDGFNNPSVYGINLIEGIDNLKKENLKTGGISFSHYVKTLGAYYTLDGMCSQFLGVPLAHIPFDVHFDHIGFEPLLKNTPSIFNLLKNMSYETVAFTGASRDITQKGGHLEIHGVDTVFGREHWQGKGFPLNDVNSNGQFGFNDEFLFNRLRDYLANRTSDKQFAIFFETSDTHWPRGFVTNVDRRFGDQRDSFIRCSRLVTEFMTWAKEQPWYKDTVIVVVGDHPWQDLPRTKKLFNRFTKKSNNRQIYNLILHSEARPVREITGWCSMDMAPTILHAMGISFTSVNEAGEVSHNKIGIGTSLFSNEATLIEKYGGRTLDDLLMKPNKLYDSLL